MVELSGALKTLDLLPMVKFLADLRQSGFVDISSEGWSARLCLRDGRLVAASFAEARGLGAIKALGLVMSQAEFVYSHDTGPAEQNVDLSVDALRSYLEPKPDRFILALDALPRVICDRAAKGLDDDRIFLDRSTLRTLLAIDGRRTLREILDEGPRAGTLLDLARLLDLGIVTLDYAEPQRRVLPPAAKDETLVLGRHDTAADNGRIYETTSPNSHRALEAGLGEPSPEAGTSYTDGPDTWGWDTAAQARPLPVEAADSPPSRSDDSGFSRLLPAISIALVATALIMSVLAFVRPHPSAPDVSHAPTGTAAVEPTRMSAQPATTTQGPSRVASTSDVAAPSAAVPAGSAVSSSANRAPEPAQVAEIGPPLLDVSFANPQPNWRENAPFVSWADGALRLSPRLSGRFVALGAPLSAASADVQVTATFHKMGGPAGGGYGIIVRDQEPTQRDGSNQNGHFYVLAVGDQGEIGVWRREESRWVDILSWTHSEAVKSGNALNELTVRAVGRQLSLLVNGVEVTTQSDSSVNPGGVGVFVGGDQNDVALERFRVDLLTAAQ